MRAFTSLNKFCNITDTITKTHVHMHNAMNMYIVKFVVICVFINKKFGKINKQNSNVYHIRVRRINQRTKGDTILAEFKAI